MLHCSDSNFGDVTQVTHWHKKRGFDNIGYNWIITSGVLRAGDSYEESCDGRLQEGRSTVFTGAHAMGFNESHLSVCLIGKYHFTWSQFVTLACLLREIKHKYIPTLEAKDIIGHYERDAYKTCPNINMHWFRWFTAKIL